MVNIGCKFMLDDLDGQTWSELIMLALERDRIRDLVSKAKAEKDEVSKTKPTETTAFRTARKELGVPESGASLFPQSKPMR